jgi:hypothetical protein
VTALAYLLAGLAALGALWALDKGLAYSLDEPTLVEQWRKVWAEPVIRLKVGNK